MFFKQGMTGGVSYIKKDILKWIMNLVKIMIKKNLKIIWSTVTWIIYGHTMSQCLPYWGFKWVKNIDKIKQKIMNTKVIAQLDT